jgi:carbamoyltransferase
VRLYWRLGEKWKLKGLAAYGTVRPAIRGALGAVLIADQGRLRFADEALLSRILERFGPLARALGHRSILTDPPGA